MLDTEEKKQLDEVLRISRENSELLKDHGKVLQENTEVLHFIQENMVMREEFVALDSKVTSLDQKVDHILGRLDSMDKELADIKQSLIRLEKKTQEDDDAMTSEIFLLKRRVNVLEQQLKQLHRQPA